MAGDFLPMHIDNRTAPAIEHSFRQALANCGGKYQLNQVSASQWSVHPISRSFALFLCHTTEMSRRKRPARQ